MADKDKSETYQSIDGWVGNPDLMVSLDGSEASSRFVGFHSINLTRRIFVSNFIALGILLIGVLFITQPQSKSFVVLRDYLNQQADFQQKIYNHNLLRADVPVSSFSMLDILNVAPKNTGVTVAIYSPELEMLGQNDATLFRDYNWAGEDADSNSLNETFLVNVIKLFRGVTVEDKEIQSLADFNDKVVALVASGDENLKQVSLDNDTIMATGRSLTHNGQLVGYFVLSTPEGLLNGILQTRTQGIFSFFFLALLVALFFAAILARSITNPLHDLARAAEIGKTADLGHEDARKVLIPDMAGRKDVVGRLAAAMGDMTQALYNRIETNESFAADVAHEIKNPLASMRSAVETLRFARNDEGKNKLLDILEKDVQRLDRLVSDISNASRLDAELVSEETESFELTKMLRNIVEFHRIEAEKNGIDLYWEGPEKPIMVDGLEERIAQVFVNLVTNALSFCKEGDAVRVWSRLRGNRILAVVEDTGPGIPEDSREEIFRRFYSQRPVDDFGNHSGLGLAISKQIIEAHGGTIWAENIRNEDESYGTEVLGARFVVGLPA